MSMYILKPWYKKDERTVTTTYQTKLYYGSASFTGSNYSTFYANLSRYPSISIKSSTKSLLKSSSMSLSYTMTLPQALFTLGNFDTTRSIFQTNNMKSTLIKLSEEPDKFFSSSSTTYMNDKTFIAGLSTLTYNKNSDLAYFSYGAEVTGNSSSTLRDAMTFYKTGAFLRQGVSIGSINDNYNIFSMEQFYTYENNKARYGLTKWHPVCFQITDPTKVTVMWDGYFWQPAAYANLSVQNITLYEATLSEVHN